MPRILTNNVSLAYAIEAALGVPGAAWRLLEPNTIGAFGANITTISRSPISRNRQRRKGTVTDLDSSIEFESDLTLSAFRDFLEGFIFSMGVNRDVTNIASTAAVEATDAYTVAALVAAQANKMEIGTLLWSSGFVNAGNNGLKSVDADIATAAVAISVSESLVDESAASGLLSLAGYRIPASEDPTWTYAGTQATLSGVAGIGTILGALGLIVGQVVHIGSVASAGAGVINGFQNAAPNDMVGYARVRSISTDAIIFDKLDPALRLTDSTPPATAVDILFGEFFRNVATNDPLYLERSFQFEADFPNLGAGGVSEYQYALGNFCNTLGFNLPITDKATLAFAFIGTDTENPTLVRKAGAGAAVSPRFAAAFNTSADIARLRITDVDEDGLTTDFKSLSFTFNNNVSPEKTVGRLGARYINAGNFLVDIEAQLIFTNPDVVERIRSNATVTMDFFVRNENGVIAVDIPSMTLGGGGREFPVDESILINTTGEAYRDDLLGTSIGVSIIPVPLP